MSLDQAEQSQSSCAISHALLSSSVASSPSLVKSAPSSSCSLHCLCSHLSVQLQIAIDQCGCHCHCSKHLPSQLTFGAVSSLELVWRTIDQTVNELNATSTQTAKCLTSHCLEVTLMLFGQVIVFSVLLFCCCLTFLLDIICTWVRNKQNISSQL